MSEGGGSVEALIDLNDSDILAIEQVLIKLNEKQGKRQSLEPFRKEVVDRFADAGFGVKVATYMTDQQGVYAFDITIEERLAGEFDPDKMVYEATHDVLELGEGGVITEDGKIKDPKQTILRK